MFTVTNASTQEIMGTFTSFGSAVGYRDMLNARPSSATRNGLPMFLVGKA